MAYSFTAASSHRLTIAEASVTAAPLTISAWFKPTGVAAANLCLAAITDTAAANTRFALIQSTTAISANAHDGAASGAASTASPNLVVADQWQHAAGVFTTTTSRDAYRNGTVGTNNTTSVTPASLDTTAIGARVNSSTSWFFDGLIAEVAIWDVALSGTDITALAAGDSPMSLATAPVRYWRLKDNGDLTDLVGAVELTATGATHSSDHPNVDDPPSTGNPSGLLLMGIG